MSDVAGSADAHAAPVLSGRTLIGLGLVASLVSANSSMIAVALPDIADDFGIESGTAGILVTAYLVVMLIGQPAAGRVTDALGSRTVLRWSLAFFVAMSVVAPFASTFPLLVSVRSLQACAAAAFVPASQSLVRALSAPSQLGRSFGVIGSFLGGGATAGPVVGGLVTGFGGWQAVFLVNLPLVAVAAWLLRDMPQPVLPPAKPRREDTDDGADEAGHVNVFRNPVFRAAFASQSAFVFAQYSLLLMVPIVLDAEGWSSVAVGLGLSTMMAGLVVMGPIGGRVGDRRGRRWPVMVGFSVGLAGYAMVTIAIETSPVLLIATLAVLGVGLGFGLPSITTAAMESVPADATGSASGLLSMSRYLGSIPASLLLAVLVTEGGDGAMVQAALATGAMALALLAGSRLPSEPTAAASTHV